MWKKKTREENSGAQGSAWREKEQEKLRERRRKERGREWEREAAMDR